MRNPQTSADHGVLRTIRPLVMYSDVLNGCDDKLKGASLNVADGRWRPHVAQLAFIVYGIILATDASVPTDSGIGMTPDQGYEEQKWISRQRIEMAGPQTREGREYRSTT